jgi:SPP1 gp7 family putative phage head morphogenesis protein
MKTLKPLIFKPSFYAEAERSIKVFFWESIYKPIVKELNKFGIEIKNATSPLSAALEIGKVYFERGEFAGSFNSSITKELRKIGATFNRKTSTWKLSSSKLPVSIKLASETGQSKLIGLQKNIILTLDTSLASLGDKLEQETFDFIPTLNKANTDLQKSMKLLNIEVKLTDSHKKIIQEQWQKNLKLSIKDWADKDILQLREFIKTQVFAGGRASSMESIIKKGFERSQTKARFLARQETALLVSKLREVRYKDAGLEKYIWSTSDDVRVRPFHARLDGKTYLWESPPIVDNDGNRKHPGEDFNCRCLAIPVLDEAA